jgi:NarL family two-component system response regulator YdfI
MRHERLEGQNIRVLIADDHLMVRIGLRLMLEMGEGFEVVGEASDGAEAIRLVESVQPDVVLMDLRMPGVDGLAAIPQMSSRWPQVAILILTTYDDDDLMIRGLQAGARGYLLKDTSLEALVQALRAVARGEMTVQPEMMERLVVHAAEAARLNTASTRPAREKRPTALTERELEVLAGVAAGERSKEIAKRLGLSERTIWAHLTSIYTKLGVDSRASAVALAMERGLLPRRKGLADRDTEG